MKKLILTALLIVTNSQIFSSVEIFNISASSVTSTASLQNASTTYIGRTDGEIYQVDDNIFRDDYNVFKASYDEFHSKFRPYEERLAIQNQHLDQLEEEYNNIKKSLENNEKYNFKIEPKYLSKLPNQHIQLDIPITQKFLTEYLSKIIYESDYACRKLKTANTINKINQIKHKNNDDINYNQIEVDKIAMQLSQAETHLDITNQEFQSEKLSVYGIENNDQLSAYTWKLSHDLSDARYTIDACTLQLRLFDVIQESLHKKNKEYDYILTLLQVYNHKSEITQRWKTISYKALFAMRRKEISDSKTHKAYELMRNHAIAWKINKEKVTQAKIAAEIIQSKQLKQQQAQQEKELRQQRKQQEEYKKIQEAKLAADKRAEQSKADKKRHENLKKEKELVEQQNQKLKDEKKSSEQQKRALQSQLAKKRNQEARLAAEQKLEIPETNPKSNIDKTSIEIDEQTESASNPMSDTSNPMSDNGTAIATALFRQMRTSNLSLYFLHNGSELTSLNQSNSEPTPSNLVNAVINLYQISDIERYNQFIQWRNEQLAHLEKETEAAKISIKKENLTKLLRCKAADRNSLKAKLEHEFEKKYASAEKIYVSYDEKKIIELLHRYHETLSNKTMAKISLDQFTTLKNLIISTHDQLVVQKKLLKWYLMINPALYKNIKTRYITFKKIVTIFGDIENIELRYNHCLYMLESPISQAECNSLLKEIETLNPIYKNIQIFKELRSLHENNGILDITNLLYTPKTYEDIESLGILAPETLQRGTAKLNEVYVQQQCYLYNNDDTTPIIKGLFEQAGIHPSQNILNQVIKYSRVKLNDINEFTVAAFLNLQRKIEMEEELYTPDQIADIVKIHVCIINAIPQVTH